MELMTVGAIKVHELSALDGVFDDPSWTFGFGFDPKVGEAIGATTGTCQAILLGRGAFEMVAPAWSMTGSALR
jgi:hypothetical protein